MPTEQTTEVAVIVLDKLEQYFTAAQQVMDKYGGEAVDLGLNALRIDAASGLLAGMVCLGVVYLLWRVFPPKTLFMKASEIASERGARWQGDQEIYHFIGGVVSIIAILFFGIKAVTTLGDLWAWVGLFYPELYAVHKFIIN